MGDESKTARILIVEDDPEHQYVISELLRYEGFAPAATGTAGNALELVAKERFAVAIVDLLLPDLRGTELLQRIRETDDAIRVIIHTGYASFDSARDSVNLGAFAYVEKPSHPDELIRHVHRAVRGWMEDALRRSEARYGTLAEMSPDGIFHADAEGRLLYVNQRWCETTGLAAAEALGRGWLRAFHPDDRRSVEAAWYESVAAGRPFRAEHRFRQATGETVWVYCQTRAEVDDAGEFTGFIGTVTDITERKRVEAELRRAKVEADAASEAKSQFLARMSHEIRTPMNSIIAMAGFLAKSELPDEERSYVDTLRSSADALLQLIDSVLDFSKIEAGALSFHETDFRLRDTVKTVREMLAPRAAEKRLELHTHVHREVPEVLRGDPSRLLQVLMNLVDNAIKFTPEGRVELAVRRSPGGVEVVVRDTGIGISPELRERIFDPFTQADGSMSRPFGGTGLGLAISQRIVEAMGGTLALESAPGKGSTFSFTVDLEPARHDGGTPEAEPAPGRKRPADGCHILIAEDNPVNRIVVSKQVANLGYRATTVENGLQALEALQQERFDLVLMDCQMPQLDGYEATRRIRCQETGAEHLPVIAVTAHAVNGERERCLATGMDDFLSKPYREEELAAVLDRWLAAR